MNKLVWTIGGSDSAGGAGIVADVKAMQSFGTHSCTLVTALTAQNSMGLEAINPVALDVLASQLKALEQDMRPAVIKIGMLANEEQIKFIAQKIQEYKASWECAPLVVYDPIIVTSTGENLAEDDVVPAIKQHLLPLVDVLTPNTRETQTLTGVYLIGPGAVRDAANAFFKMGVNAVTVKGGHWDYPQGYCIDYCASSDAPDIEYWLGNKTLTTPHKHGAGCSFASVIAACLAQQYPLKDAFILAKAYINQGLKAAKRFGQGIGPLAHCGFPQSLDDFPQVIEADSFLGLELDLDPIADHPPAIGFAACEDRQLGLYPVVDSLAWLKLCLENGIKTVQLRIKDTSELILETVIKRAIELGEKHRASVFINHHWQLAIKHGAYGVHLGHRDLLSADLAAIKSGGLRLGLSTHGFYEMLMAHNYQPSYIAFAADLAKAGQAQGLETLKHFAVLMRSYPTLAMGDIGLSRIKQVAQTRVDGVAVGSAITQADDPVLAIKALNTEINCD